jgi:hypothetical protein
MPCQHRSGHAFDVLTASDIADLVLAPELRGERPQAVLAAGEEDDAPALAGETAGDRLADPARRAGDDGYTVVLYRQTFT